VPTTATTAPPVNACTTVDLGTGNGLWASPIFYLAVVNHTKAPCWVEGTIDATFLGDGGRLLARADQSSALAPEHIVVAPTEHFYVIIQIRGAWEFPGCGATVIAKTLRMYQPAHFDVLDSAVEGMQFSLCANPVGQVRVAPLRPGNVVNPPNLVL
jgi:hypothetical protein